ncbi:MAG: MFS transporter [Pseudomonadota bacterium]|nr:MFS transporter [Alphaproteobacteria bacterium]
MFGLNRDQGESVALLSIGTFLEYFDLMIYIHMAVLLNELFFPKTDAHTASLLTAFAFCSTYLLRPIGALIFGYIGDHIGRKVTVVITTTMMSFSCLIMANLPTYAQIGITAAWVVTICRIIQGMSSMGEISGAQLYLSETLQPPARYSAVAFLAFAVSLGTSAALGLASFVTSFGLNWRLAFWVGATIAVIGAVARTKLRETPDFADAKRRIKEVFNEKNFENKKLREDFIEREKVNQKTSLALFLMDCMWPLCFYFAYVYCGGLLKTTFNLTPEQIIHQNFIVSVVQILSLLLFVFLSYKVYPLVILKVKLIVSFLIMITCPYWLDQIADPFYLLLLQSAIIFFAADAAPATSIFYKYFPVFKRFTYISFTYALSRALTYVITSFGLVYLTEKFGNWGILIVMVPVCIGYMLGLRHFEKLDQINNRPPAQNLEPLVA